MATQRPSCGCPIIDNLNIGGKPVNLANNTVGMSWCLECPYETCIQHMEKSDWKLKQEKHQIKEVSAKCMNCRDMQTIVFIDGSLQETRHFKQIDNNIYHLHEYDMSLKRCKLF